MTTYPHTQERLGVVLVINKIDRLITELRLTTTEAYTRLKAIVAHVNLIMVCLIVFVVCVVFGGVQEGCVCLNELR